ncbi:hypothetical protein B1690_17515 [Geobacillus sp. 46C-IIa]|uniref:hypothetical protein n=1 Tax=Geobacillus sp. 46C-IIa TaxID=1963025 RepID=UPI0009BD3885|nr:hypothetical protein [Geobacillus sp. 46C-IIa]OQP03572.1 hypothetical protein B1690_17515 [Geobacillus sp. 46C-IIa]QNU26687.1 hypothetical protein IC803_10180 [Geobacillus sp. 46C-IIa]
MRTIPRRMFIMTNGQPFVVQASRFEDDDEVVVFVKTVTAEAPACLCQKRKQRLTAAANLRAAMQMGALLNSEDK